MTSRRLRPGVPVPPRRGPDTQAGNGETPRLSKRISELGLASRREADEWIAAGWVRVDGVVVDTLGARVRPEQKIDIDPRARRLQSAHVTVLLHKPVGYVSGQAEDGYRPAIVLVTPENRWRGDRAPIEFSRAHLRGLAVAGRLDIDSTGLLVLTQDGRIARQLIGADSAVEKEYLVRVEWPDAPRSGPLNGVFPADRMQLLRHGLALDGVPLRAARVSWQNEEQLRFVLREGRKRQIRRMCEAVGLKVVGLKRVRIGSVALGALPAGQWRYLRADEAFA
jgi:23S rRNA pseudouridine2604 synthase